MIALPLLFGSLGWPEIVLIVLVVLIFFGAKRIPELMKSLGKGVKSFKQGIACKSYEKLCCEGY